MVRVRRINVITLIVVITSLSSGTTPLEAVVIRHDRTDADAIEMGKRFAAAGRLSDGGCTLVRPTWAITAAHVAMSLQPQSRLRFGEREYAVKRVILHPEGKARGVPPEVDLALIELAEPVTNVEPVALYRGREEQGKTVYVVGYGDYGVAGQPIQRSDGRRRAATNVIHDAGPRRLFMRFDAPPAGTELEGVGGPGDSGGPLFIEENGRLYLAGVSSASMDGKPGSYGVVDVYTRVSSYVDWIEPKLAAGAVALATNALDHASQPLSRAHVNVRSVPPSSDKE